MASVEEGHQTTFDPASLSFISTTRFPPPHYTCRHYSSIRYVPVLSRSIHVDHQTVFVYEVSRPCRRRACWSILSGVHHSRVFQDRLRWLWNKLVVITLSLSCYCYWTLDRTPHFLVFKNTVLMLLSLFWVGRLLITQVLIASK